MKKLFIIIMCLIALAGCTSPERSYEIDYEIYEKGYEEGYIDAIEAMIDQIPWYLIDEEEFEDALYKVFDDGKYAEEIRDQILSHCELYERSDFIIDYSDSGIDYNFD